MKNPCIVTVTGAAGQIGYSLLPRIAAGDVFGAGQPVILRLLEIPSAMKTLEGVVMELLDCAFPLLAGIEVTDSPDKAFDRTQWVFLVGSLPRRAGMQRKDLLLANAPIFVSQGKALNTHAAKDVRVLVVGNPANTNALIVSSHAADIPRQHFSAMTRLDHNRSIGLLATRLGVQPEIIKRMIVWGNHSDTMVPDMSHVTVSGHALSEIPGDLSPLISGRGAAIIAARGSSSALSAAQAAVCHVHDLSQSTGKDDWVSMAVYSQGEYGVPPGVFFSFPCTCQRGEYSIVPGLTLDDDVKEKIRLSAEELLKEREAVSSFLPL